MDDSKFGVIDDDVKKRVGLYNFLISLLLFHGDVHGTLSWRMAAITLCWVAACEQRRRQRLVRSLHAVIVLLVVTFIEVIIVVLVSLPSSLLPSLRWSIPFSSYFLSICRFLRPRSCPFLRPDSRPFPCHHL